ASAQAGRGMVQGAPPRRSPCAAGGAGKEAARSLWVLRHRRKLQGDRALPLQGDEGVAQVAEPPLGTRLDDLVAHEPAAGALPAPTAAHRAPPPPTCSESMTRRAGCGKPARPGPWGAGDWNLPGLPD